MAGSSIAHPGTPQPAEAAAPGRVFAAPYPTALRDGGSTLQHFVGFAWQFGMIWITLGATFSGDGSEGDVYGS